MASNEDKSNCSRFHQKYGQLVVLSDSGTTASRTHANQEFNHGLIMSSSPLQEDRIFEVRIDKKINSWSGSIEVVRKLNLINDDFRINLLSFVVENFKI